MSRRHVPHLTLAVVGIVTLGAIAVSVHTDKAANVVSSTHSPNKTNPYGGAAYGFGGYTLYRFTSEIGAEWRVPAINTHSPDGDASTWIGVEDGDRQFIQLGTTEDKTNGVTMYGVFWSDVTVNFNPQQLLNVAPGDLIKFTMHQNTGGWRLSFDDVSNGTPETITVPYARGSTFNLGQWIQEDPTEGGLSQHLPYPSMQAPTFRDLTLDTSVPKVQENDAQVLSTVRGVHLVPTLPTHNQFTFHNATGAARQYLNDVFGYDVALYPLQVAVFDKQPPSAATLAHLETSIKKLREKWQTQTWPANLRGPIQDDVNEMSEYLTLYKEFPTKPKKNSMFAARYNSLNAQNSLLSRRVHHLLGLPPPS
jgi:peptidase A4-like protein